MQLRPRSEDSALYAIMWTIPSSLLFAFVVKTLWGWFMVPLGIKAIGMAHAYGIGILIGMFQSTYPSLVDENSALKIAVYSTVKSILFLLLGFVAYSLMR